MFKFIEGLPPNVRAIEATGKVTHDDYQNTFIPKAEAMLAKGPIRMLYVIGKEFTGFELEARHRYAKRKIERSSAKGGQVVTRANGLTYKSTVCEGRATVRQRGPDLEKLSTPTSIS